MIYLSIGLIVFVLDCLRAFLLKELEGADSTQLLVSLSLSLLLCLLAWPAVLIWVLWGLMK